MCSESPNSAPERRTAHPKWSAAPAVLFSPSSPAPPRSAAESPHAADASLSCKPLSKKTKFEGPVPGPDSGPKNAQHRGDTCSSDGPINLGSAERVLATPSLRPQVVEQHILAGLHALRCSCGKCFQIRHQSRVRNPAPISGPPNGNSIGRVRNRGRIPDPETGPPKSKVQRSPREIQCGLATNFASGSGTGGTL